MTRIEGFLFTYPGFPSLSVPYHDTNDFFFSGHIGTCLLVFLEYRSAKWSRMSYFALFIMVNQWIMMMLVRTHYVIDMVTGLLVAHYMYIHAEKLSYYADILMFGVSAKDRNRCYYKPCKYCGWNNRYAGDFMSTNEKKLIKSIYRSQ